MAQSTTIEEFAALLRKGELPEAQPWDVAAVVQALADDLARRDSGLSVGEIRLALKALNGGRLYEHTRLLAESWTAHQAIDPTVVKHHAQALINLSALDGAEKLLVEGLAGAGLEALEFEGLLGRVAKQRFVASGDPDALVAATDRYLAQYLGPTKPYWHGINAVALRAREERDGLHRTPIASSQALASEIFDQVTQLYRSNADNPWLPATASEAALARGDCDNAELWLYRFLHHPKVTPFAAESYERQIREIWQGNALGGGGSCADRLASILFRHVDRTQRKLSLSPSDIGKLRTAVADNATDLEKNFSGESSFTVDVLKSLLAACASIGCVCNKRGERLGTGFVIDGRAFGLDAGPLFVTNAHVLSETVPNAIRQADALVTFEVESAAANQPVFYPVKEIVFTSPPGELGFRCPSNDHLDVTIVRLEGRPDRFAGLAVAGYLPLVEPKAKAYVVGHPRGSGLQISLHDSQLLDIDDEERLIHYRTPTDPGNSGSPVFSAAWEVIGVHHGGSATTSRLRGTGSYEANEAIALGAIRRKLGS